MMRRNPAEHEEFMRRRAKEQADWALSSLTVFGCVERMLEGGDTNLSDAAVRKIIRICKAEGIRLVRIYDANRVAPTPPKPERQ